MKVKEIVKKFLVKNGYAGLRYDDGCFGNYNCKCTLQDFMPCACCEDAISFPDCEPYKNRGEK